MKLILLPGNSPNNKEWIDQMHKELHPLFPESEVQYFDHWKDQISLLLDIKRETQKLKASLKGKECVVFAKSAGIAVTLVAIRHGAEKPKKCIFVGLPLSPMEKISEEIHPNFKNYEIPTLFIQQTYDPYANFFELKKFLIMNKLKNYELKEVSGNDHFYSDTKQISRLVEEYLRMGKK